MQLKGHKLFDANVARCYDLLTDPQILVRTMPGLKTMEPLGEGRFSAEFEVGVAAVRGHYAGTIVLEEAGDKQSYCLTMEGQGASGFVTLDLAVRFKEAGSGCDVIYDGEAKVGGTVASVGQRMLSMVASFITKQFFGNVAKEAALAP